MKDIREVILKLIKFRGKMGLGLSLEKVKYIWGKRIVKSLDDDLLLLLDKSESKNIYIDEKLDIANLYKKKLLIFNWVKFIGVSGSVAAGFAKEKDDIDIFIVVKNGCVWLYRGLLVVRGLFNNVFRAKRHGENVRNKLCLNLICEERGVVFDNDLFTFHELMYLIPIYNNEYLKYIYSQNPWLVDDYAVKKEIVFSRYKASSNSNFIVRFFNYLSFWAQYIYMILSRHSPSKKRLLENFKKGKIEFFDEDYKQRFI
jgi:predicted nucleotidyltransferase